MIKEKKILHILKTQSLLSDGRVLKTVASLKRMGYRSSIVLLEDVNRREKKNEDDYDVFAFSLFTRKFFKQRTGYLFKIPEFTIKSIWYSLKQDANIWIFQDSQSYLSILLLPLIRLLSRKRKFVIWDQHELPHPIFLKTSLTRWLYKRMLKNVDNTIFTNKDRKSFVSKHFKLFEPKGQVLNNYPSVEYVNMKKTNLAEDVKSWLDGHSYFLWQGMAVEDRNFNSALMAYYQFRDKYKFVILGRVSKESLAKIKELFGDDYSKFIYHRFVPQDEIIKYIDSATLSFVFYHTEDPNNKYCEANRIYQPITRGIPVICGNNPPLKRIIDTYDMGVVLDDDGSNYEGVIRGVKKVLNNYEYYTKNCVENKAEFCWDVQCEEVYSEIIKSYKLF